jgi:pyroglutamyl-peptidase
MTTRVLLTGFEPFGGEAVNPSWEAVRALDGWRTDGATVHARRIACVFGQALQELDAAIDDVQPHIVITVGQAGGRAEITPERVAINVDDARIPDNAGRQPIDVPVRPGAPAAYFSSLPIKAIVRDLRAAGLPAAVSNTAGTFVCNHLFFGLMHRIAGLPIRGGFIHIPYLPQQGQPSVALPDLVQALRIAVQTTLRVQDDVHETGGTLH